MNPQLLILIAFGGALGAVARYVISGQIGRLLGADFPFGTAVVNISGSLLMGLLMGWMMRFYPAGKPELHAFLAIGFLGSFTTFSTFSLDVMLMLERGETILILGYILFSVTLAIFGLMAGITLGRML